MSEPIVISIPTAGGAVPATYELTSGEAWEALAVYGEVDGSAASAPFLPALAIYSQADVLLARVPISPPLAPGDTAKVTWATAVEQSLDQLVARSSLTISAASTNSTLVAAGYRLLTGWAIENNGAGYAYVKLYDKATAPTVGTDTPAAVLPAPPSGGANISLARPVRFVAGLGLGITGGLANGDTTAVGASQVGVTLFYV